MITVKCYDNGGKTIDRYTIVFVNASYYRNSTVWEALAASENPFHPQGVGLHVCAEESGHLGEIIKFSQLPEPVQRFAMEDIEEYRQEGLEIEMEDEQDDDAV